jgi:hypothetical protein
VLENLQSTCVPGAGTFSHQSQKGNPLSLAGLLSVKVLLFVPNVRSSSSSGTFLAARLSEGLLPLGRPDGKIKGSRRPCKGRKVHIRRAPASVVGIIMMLRQQKTKSFKFRARASSLGPREEQVLDMMSLCAFTACHTHAGVVPVAVQDGIAQGAPWLQVSWSASGI